MQGSAADDTHDKHLLGAALRELRRRASLTQEELAARANADPTYLSQLEKGGRDTRWTTVMRLLRALNASIVDLADAIAEVERQD